MVYLLFYLLNNLIPYRPDLLPHIVIVLNDQEYIHIEIILLFGKEQIICQKEITCNYKMLR